MTSQDSRIAQARLAAAEAGDPASVRVDAWLWSVRQVKSRAVATAACKAGHVRVNGETAKPAQRLVVGDEIRYRVAGFDRDLVVLRLLSKRVGAPIARTAYLDRTPPRPSPLDAPAAIVRDRGAGRPTKKERRALDRLRDAGPVVDIERILDRDERD